MSNYKPTPEGGTPKNLTVAGRGLTYVSPSPPWPDKAAGTAARGYGAAHQALRRKWARKVARGTVACWRCEAAGLGLHALIDPGEEWHLGHDDWDRSITRGPEHADCNLRRLARQPPPRYSRDWFGTGQPTTDDASRASTHPKGRQA